MVTPCDKRYSVRVPPFQFRFVRRFPEGFFWSFAFPQFIP